MLERIASMVWGPGLLVLLLGTGLWLSLRSHFFQLRSWKTILHETFGGLRRGSGNTIFRRTKKEEND